MEKNKITKIISELTLDEKVSLLSGWDYWKTTPIEHLGIPSVSMSDGPHGLRKQTDVVTYGVDGSAPSTCFPTASLLACSWDPELAKLQGTAIGEEAQALDVNIVLGPGVNIKRSPLCGRNFEYFSEDPYLSSKMAGGIIDGIQSTGVSACIKHFAANNQETDRLSIDALIEERPLREIYLASFEDAVKLSKPKAVMCSYNKINGHYSAQNKWLLTDVLRDEWGFNGIVMSDWGAVDNRPQAVWAGLELEMPSSYGANSNEIIKAVKGEKVYFASSDENFNNTLTMEQIDIAVERMLEFIFKLEETADKKPCDFEANHHTARVIARECMVLLENNGVLPLKRDLNIGVIGEMAENPRYQGSGSSRVNPITISKPIDAISEFADVSFARGYSLNDVKDFSHIEDALKVAANEEYIILIAGLPDSFESEGYDRKHMRLPENQLELIDKVAEINKNVILVLCGGSPVEMPFKGKCAAVLMAYLGGESSGDAIADIIFGDYNPSGKLAETFPEKLEHNPSFINFPGDGKTVTYGEGLFVGYRWYDKTTIKPLYPFGYGLSYTSFDYSDIKLSTDSINQNDVLTVSCTIKNSGNFDGKEIAELYVREKNPAVPRPVKELKGFKKIELNIGESKTINFELDNRAFSYWNTELKEWTINSGEYEILIGASVEDIRLCASINVTNTNQKIKDITFYSFVSDLIKHPNGAELMYQITEYFKAKAKKENVPEPVGTSGFEWLLIKTLMTLPDFIYNFSEMQEKLNILNRSF